jgi:itaconyl-CoA hydratase
MERADTPVLRVERGHYYEDFEVGRRFVHHWGRTFTLHDTVAFSTLTMQHNPLYFNQEYARYLGYREIPVHPLLLFATVLGLTVEDLSEAAGPFLGADDIRFGVPAYPGDTVYAVSEVVGRRESRSRPGWGIVEWKTVGFNQQGEVVIEYRRRNLVRLRAGGRPELWEEGHGDVTG